jgi:hypothetical protein
MFTDESGLPVEADGRLSGLELQITPGLPKATLWFNRILPTSVGLLVALGLGARCRQYLAAPSYWYDEAYLLLNIFDKTCAELTGPLHHDQAAPVGFLWCLRLLYGAAGASECVMRLPSLLASVLALGLMVPLARALLSGPGWLWGVGFCAVCQHGVTHAVEVKPYAGDLFMTVAILLASGRYLSCHASRSPRRAGLFAVAWLGPWFSFPSVFLLGGASLALLVIATYERKTSRWLCWATFTAQCLLSTLALWALTLRRLQTNSLEAYWAHYFGGGSSPFGMLSWVVHCLIAIGNYGSNGLGIPLLLLGMAGAALLARRSPSQLVLLTCPLLLAMAASQLHFYPLDDRLQFFLVPCVWLLAAEALGALARFLARGGSQNQWNNVFLAGLGLLLVPGAVQMCKDLRVVHPKAAFREALEFVDLHGSSDDVCWVSHPEMVRVYRGHGRDCLGPLMPAEEVARRARGHRLWVVHARGSCCADFLARMELKLKAAGMVQQRKVAFEGLEVVSFVDLQVAHAP